MDRYVKVEKNLYRREYQEAGEWQLKSLYAIFTDRTRKSRRFNLHTRDIAEARLHLANYLHQDRFQNKDFDAPKKEREAKRRQALEEKQRQVEEQEKAKADQALLFRNWSSTYMEKYAPKKSAVRDEFSLRNLNRHLGDMPIDKITRLVLQEYKKTRIAEPIVRNGHAVTGTRTSAACVNREFSFLQKILDAAVDGELIDNAPSFRKIRTKEKPRKRKLTHEEYVRLRDAAVPWLRDMIQANYYMGFSLSDALGLTWGQVDFREGVIEIQRRKTDQQQLCFLIEPLRAILRRLQFHQSILTARNHVFVNDRKEPVTKDQFQHAFRQALKRADLEDFRWHDFRRMVATKLAAANVPYESRLKALGHAASDIHSRHYVALSRKELLKIFENALTALEHQDEESVSARNISGELDTLSRVVEG